jgi:hypothetical protein
VVLVEVAQSIAVALLVLDKIHQAETLVQTLVLVVAVVSTITQITKVETVQLELLLLGGGNR